MLLQLNNLEELLNGGLVTQEAFDRVWEGLSETQRLAPSPALLVELCGSERLSKYCYRSCPTIETIRLAGDDPDKHVIKVIWPTVKIPMEGL